MAIVQVNTPPTKRVKVMIMTTRQHASPGLTLVSAYRSVMRLD
jgi:hypothetical protein